MNDPSFRTGLVIGIATGAAVTAVAVASLPSLFKSISTDQSLRGEKRGPISEVQKLQRQSPKQQHGEQGENGPSFTVFGGRSDFPDDLIREQLARHYAFLGEEGMTRLRSAFVIVVGVGGVGSHAAHMLLRAGVQRLRIIDFDQVTLSSLNRHSVATQADVGKAKTSVLATHLLRIFPNATIECATELFDIASADRLLSGNPDFVLDCIDNLATKVDLIAYCKEKGLRVVASMGAGAKADPSRIQIADISETFEDPLARVTRKGLKLKGVLGGVPTVYSSERPGKIGLLPLEEEKVPQAGEFATLPNFRARVLPVLGTIPTMFGCAMASYVITELGGFPTDPLPVKNRTRTYDRIIRDMRVTYITNRKKRPIDVLVTINDVGFVLDEVYRGRSIVSGVLDKEKITLVPWNPAVPIVPANLVCLTKAEAALHEKEFWGEEGSPKKSLRDIYGDKVVDEIEKRSEEIRDADKWR